jgi:Zn-dependent protease with chaperone function
MTTLKLTDLPPQAYEHPGDAAALDALTHVPGLDLLVRQLHEWGFERLVRIRHTGSHVRVTPDNFRELHGLLATVCETLALPAVPELYIKGSAEIGGFTVGADRPLIVLHSAAIDLLTPEELTFVIGHQIGYIKSGHCLYHDIARYLLPVIEELATAALPLRPLISMGLKLAFHHWQRTSRYTADRAGLLACQDIDVAWRTMMKWAGLPAKYYDDVNTEDFLKQAREFEDLDADALSAFAKWMSALEDIHPWTVVRAQELQRWIDTGGYAHILDVARQLPPRPSGLCPRCQGPLRGGEVYCPWCSAQVM